MAAATMMDAGCYSIGDLMAEFAVTARTLRFYEQKGFLVSPATRSKGGHRRYTMADRERLRRILAGKALGFTLAEIIAFLEREAASGAEEGLALTRVEIRRQIAGLQEQQRALKAALLRLRMLERDAQG